MSAPIEDAGTPDPTPVSAMPTAQAPSAPPAPPVTIRVPSYDQDELARRINDGSVDIQRLASTVALLNGTVEVLVHWVNEQIRAGIEAAMSSEKTPESPSPATHVRRGK